MVDLARYLMILTALSLLPLYGLWVAGGAICDARERKRRHQEI
jgi:hypothetical protein